MAPGAETDVWDDQECGVEMRSKPWGGNSGRSGNGGMINNEAPFGQFIENTREFNPDWMEVDINE